MLLRVAFRKLLPCGLMVFLATPSEAHHSAVQFNLEQITAISGTVISYEWRNPHVYITVEDGQGRNWLIETDATPILTRSGWTRDTLAAGDLVAVRAHPGRTPNDPHVLLVSIQTPDGRVLDSLNRSGRENEVTRGSTSSLAGVWTSSRSQVFSFIASWQNHPLTARGREALAEYDRSLSGVTQCIPWPTPFMMASNYWYLTDVTLSEDRMVIRSEFYDAERTIWLDGRQHPEDGPRTIHGHSIGRWEDDVLVVDTTLFADHPSPVVQYGVPSGSEKRVVERWRLSDDGSTVSIDLQVEDPEYLAEPFSAVLTWNYAPALSMISAPCEPEVAERFLQ